MDSSVSPTHGEQENSMWNGHYDCTCYHPLFVRNSRDRRGLIQLVSGLLGDILRD